MPKGIYIENQNWSEERRKKMSEYVKSHPLPHAFKKGNKFIPWNKGKKLSEEYKRKLSESHKGKKLNFQVWNKGKSKFISEVSKIMDTRGYIWIYYPSHQCANNGGFVREHRYVVEKYLGRYLTKDEIIHHIDGNKSNNNKENLKITSYFKHLPFQHKKICCPYCQRTFLLRTHTNILSS
jgi:hypothetical protein